MNHRGKDMEIGEAEKQLYFEQLQLLYGKDILDREDLDTAKQKLYENKRHEFNSGFRLDIQDKNIFPDRLLINVTQQCSSHCVHCWVFGSPRAACSLSANELRAIHNHTMSTHTSTWTLSGGEFFVLPYYPEILEKFPIQCIFTNCYWGHPAGKCSRYIKKLKRALNKNPLIDKNRFYLILSYDRYHREGIGKNFPLAAAVAGIIHTLYTTMPEISIRISHIKEKNNKNDFYAVIHELVNMGYEAEKTERDDKNLNINTISFSYSKTNGIKKELFIDIFPVTPVCRGLFLSKSGDAPYLSGPGENSLAGLLSERTNQRYQYTIGPDGGVGLYEILYAPPVPYRLGNLVHQPWKTIEERILHDPIAMTLKANGLPPFIDFMKTNYQDLFRAISGHIRTVQQFLYLVLLHPVRRLLLNTYLLRNSLTFYDYGVLKRIDACLDTGKAITREKSILELYGVDHCR